MAAYTGSGKTVTETRCGTAVTTAYNKYGKPLSVSENGVLTEYTYDAFGNLTQTKTKKDGGSSEQITSSAVYDSATGGKTSETDANGNILTKTKNNVTTNYAYSATWGDLLTKYGTEDNIIYNNGYPTTYRGKTFSWDRNMLSSYTNNYGTTYSFTYDVYGKRINLLRSLATTASMEVLSYIM